MIMIANIAVRIAAVCVEAAESTTGLDFGVGWGPALKVLRWRSLRAKNYCLPLAGTGDLTPCIPILAAALGREVFRSPAASLIRTVP
jgi:hypothetical protein